MLSSIPSNGSLTKPRIREQNCSTKFSGKSLGTKKRYYCLYSWSYFFRGGLFVLPRASIILQNALYMFRDIPKKAPKTATGVTDKTDKRFTAPHLLVRNSSLAVKVLISASSEVIAHAVSYSYIFWWTTLIVLVAALYLAAYGTACRLWHCTVPSILHCMRTPGGNTLLPM